MNKKQLLFAAIVTTTLFQTTLPSNPGTPPHKPRSRAGSNGSNPPRSPRDAGTPPLPLGNDDAPTPPLPPSPRHDATRPRAHSGTNIRTYESTTSHLKSLENRVTTLQAANTALNARVTTLEKAQEADRKRQAFRNRIILGTLGLASTAGVAYTFRDQLKSCSNPFSGFSNCFSGITRFFGRN